MYMIFVIFSIATLLVAYICFGSAISAACHDAKLFRAENGTEPYWFEFADYVDIKRLLPGVLLGIVSVMLSLLSWIC